MAAISRARRWKRRLLILGAALLLLGVGLVALDGYVVHVACEVDRIVYELSGWFRRTDPCLAGELRSEKGWVRGFTFLPGSTQMVLGTGYGLELWDAAGHKFVSLGPIVPEFTGGIACSSDGKRIVSVHGLHEKACVVWDVSEATHRRFRLNEVPLGNWVALSPDGRTLAVATWEGIDVYDVSKTAKVSTIVSPRGYGPKDCPVFSADGKFLLFVEGKDLFVKELRDGGMLEHIGGEDRPISDVALSPDGNWVAVAGDGFVALWHLKKKRRLYIAELRPSLQVSRPPVSVYDVAFSPDGRVVAISIAFWTRNSLAFDATRESLLLLDAASGKQLGEWQAGAHGSIQQIAFSPNGRLLGVACRGKVRLLEVSALLPTQEGHPVSQVSGGNQ